MLSQHSRQLQQVMETASAPSRMTVRVIFCGNPGVGKSTILNALVGDHKFPSGLAMGAGLTQQYKVLSLNDIEYVDTPGLADAVTGKSAATQISLALSEPDCTFTPIFVVTLEAGAVKPADVITIRNVISAIEDAGAHMFGKICVIVNKCEQEVHTYLQSETSFCMKIRSDFGQRWGPANILALPMELHASDQDNAGLHCVDEILAFVKSMINEVNVEVHRRVFVQHKDPNEEMESTSNLESQRDTLQTSLLATTSQSSLPAPTLQTPIPATRPRYIGAEKLETLFSLLLIVGLIAGVLYFTGALRGPFKGFDFSSY